MWPGRSRAGAKGKCEYLHACAYPHALASTYRAWSNYCTDKTMVARSRQQAVRVLSILFDEHW